MTANGVSGKILFQEGWFLVVFCSVHYLVALHLKPSACTSRLGLHHRHSARMASHGIPLHTQTLAHISLHHKMSSCIANHPILPSPVLLLVQACYYCFAFPEMYPG